MQKLHQSLIERSPAYARWHQSKYATLVHFIVLFEIASLLAILVFVSGSELYQLKEQMPAAIISSGASKRSETATEKLSIRDLTKQALEASGTLSKAGDEGKAEAAKALVAIAKQRKEVMKELMQTNPAGFLQEVLPANVRDSMPDAAKAFFEEDVEFSGELEAIHVEPDDFNASTYVIYNVKSGGEKLRLRLASEAPKGMLTGAKVKVQGFKIDKDVVPYAAAPTGGNDSGVTITAEADVAPLGEKRLLAILINFTDNQTQPFTPAQIGATLFSNPTSVNNFFNESSFGAFSFSGEVTNWFTIPYTGTDCTVNVDYWIQAANKAATAAGYDLTAYDHLMYTSVKPAGCGVAGYGWINGRETFILGYNNASLMAHELGHNLGTMHASTLACGTKQIDVPANCVRKEYGDPSDVMGDSWNSYVHFMTPRKIVENWLTPATALKTVTSSGRYTVSANEVNDGTLKSLKIAKADTNGFYYVSFRTPIGFDTRFSTYAPAFLNGASIHAWDSGSWDNTDLIDTTPGDGNVKNSPLSDGTTFSDPGNGVTITQVSHSSTTVTVDVTLQAAVCVPSAPTFTISPTSKGGTAGTRVDYTVTVTNNDGSTCPEETFSLTNSVPSGWSGAFGASSLIIPAKSSKSTTLSVTSASSSALGTYTFGATVQGGASALHTSTKNASYVVFTDSTGPTISLSPKNGSRIKNSPNTNISATASDPSGVESITLSVGGQVVNTCTNTTSCSYAWPTKTLPKGTYVVSATAKDPAGNSSTVTSSITK